MAESIASKLLIKPGYKGKVLNAPQAYIEKLGDLPGGAELNTRARVTLDFVQVFVKSIKDLEKDIPAAIKSLKNDGLLWIC